MTVWIGPSGARAGSAGAFIAAASDQLGMAPGTNIGSATPIGSGGEDLDAKVRNDAAAFIAALADETGRNAESYRAMVTDALNLTAEQAVDQNVAETIQPSVDAFVAWLDGRPGRNGPIATAGAPIETETLPWYLAVLRVLTDPNLVFFLLLVGLAGVGFEIFHPGGDRPRRRRRHLPAARRWPGSRCSPFQSDRHRPAGARRRPLHRRDPGRRLRGCSP